MDIKRLYRRWKRLGCPPTGLTARAVVMVAREKGYAPNPERDEAIARKRRRA